MVWLYLQWALAHLEPSHPLRSVEAFAEYTQSSLVFSFRLNNQALQTPKQKQANQKFAKRNTRIQGKPRAVAKKTEYPVSRSWLFVLVFLVCGGAVLELVRMFF
ncbi:hypothetical protein JA9_001355 [Meyerozyma sp. JA9]|nr:hypothetical protein JA9_001355 [Meyerozyma sp. JA9]